jgi:hypothetical protein
MTGIAPLTALELVLARVAHASWQAALLGLLVFGASWVLRGRLAARWRFGLWLIVLGRLALPVTPAAPWSVFRLVPISFPSPTPGGPPESLVHAPLPASVGHAGPDRAAASAPPAADVSPLLAGEPGREGAAGTPEERGPWLAGLWLAGVLKVAAGLAAPAVLPGVAGAFGKDHSLVRRIHMIAHYRKPRAAGTALGGLLLLALGAFGLTDAAAESPRQAGPRPEPPAADGKSAGTLTVAGVCEDDMGQALAGARVILYREDYREGKAERLRDAVTGDDGRFRFRELPLLPAEEDPATWGYALVVTR